MNQNWLLLGVAGAAAWYFMSQKKKEDEKLEEMEAETQALLSAKTAAEEVAAAAQEAVVAVQETAEDEPAVEAKVLEALEGAMEALDLDLLTDPGLGMIPGISGLTPAQPVGVAAEIRAGTAKMHMERIGKRLYQVTITRPDGSIVAIKARVKQTLEGPKVILFGAGEHFRDLVQKRRAVIAQKKSRMQQRARQKRMQKRMRKMSPAQRRAMAAHQARLAKEARMAKKLQAPPPAKVELDEIPFEPMEEKVITVTDDPVEFPSGELAEASNVIAMATMLLPTAKRVMQMQAQMTDAQVAEWLAHMEEQKPQMLAALRQVAEGARSGKYAAKLKGLRFRRWVVLGLRRQIFKDAERGNSLPAEDQAAIEAELNALLDAEGFPAASGEDLGGLPDPAIPNFGYLGWS